MKAITLTSFNRICFDSRCDIITYRGRYMMARRWGKYKIFLYQVDSLFVEVYRDEQADRITKLSAFDSVKGLHRYLNWITLTENGVGSRPIKVQKKKPGNRWDENQ